ncbi:MAG: M23 family metallopeptidase [Cyanobacteria bacterium J06598_3]
MTPKRPCRVTVSAPGWHGARTAAIAAGCSSVSDMIEKLGSGELSIIASDAMLPDAILSEDLPIAASAQQATLQPQHIHIHTASSTAANADDEETDDSDLFAPAPSLPKLITTGVCAAVIVGSLLYIADRIITITSSVITGKETIEDIITPLTGEIVAGYAVSDEYGIRPFHPVTGEPNVPHNGVDLAMDIGTPIYAVGKAGDSVTVKCWWDDGGGGWVVNQTAESYPGYTFQSLHMSENGCREGKAVAGDAIAYSGNSGLGTGAHYDFRIKIDGEYVPPATKYLESAVTGEPPKE